MTQFNGLLQPTQFSVKELYLITEMGTFDITMVFDELNIFDNLMTPCMSGNILIKDATNIKDKLKLNGNEFIKIKIDKGSDNPSFFNFEKQFRIYKITNDSNNNFTSQSFILHFISNEYLISESMKISQSYSGLYSDFVKKILTDHLKVKYSAPIKGSAGIASIAKSTGLIDIVIPNLTPFDAIDWISKRALFKTLPNYVFYETQFGYNFMPLDLLMGYDSTATINFNPKNIDKDVATELLGARSFKIISTFQEAENITNGAYAGTFFGFDTLTRTKQIRKISYKDDIFNKMQHGNRNPIIPDENVSKDYNARKVFYPFELSRTQNVYVKEHNSNLSNKINHTEEYKFQRKSIFYNLMQRRLQVNLPGNFGLLSGQMITAYLPKYSVDNSGDTYDKSLSGRYLIIATRHIIRYNAHETILEIATDSTNAQ